MLAQIKFHERKNHVRLYDLARERWHFSWGFMQIKIPWYLSWEKKFPKTNRKKKKQPKFISLQTDVFNCDSSDLTQTRGKGVVSIGQRVHRINSLKCQLGTLLEISLWEITEPLNICEQRYKLYQRDTL